MIERRTRQRRRTLLGLIWLVAATTLTAADLPVVPGVPGQPLASNAQRLLAALEFLGHPLPAPVRETMQTAIDAQDPDALQQALDPHVLLVVRINPELRVKVNRGPVPAPAVLHQSGFTPVLVKVLNDATVSRRLRITSPQAGPVYAGAARSILQRQQQTELNANENRANEPGRFMEVDMFLQVKGEGLNVGCVLTWGPCYDYQRQFFAPTAANISEPLTILKYDLEISGFGSAALGHVCLLNLTNQTYPGSAGTKTQGWPTWTVPVLRWTKEQGGVTGYPHSDMFVDPDSYAAYYLERHDRDGDERLNRTEAEAGLLPEPFDRLDEDLDRTLGREELVRGADRAGHALPNLVLPSMQGAGAMEIFVSAAEGVCDFISAMNTGRVGEWNTWYHLMNCGLPVKLSGETDFPCMSSLRVGQGRVYVKLADQHLDRIDFQSWCRALARGQSYVSDGYAHALDFTVQGVAAGTEDVMLDAPGRVTIRARVAFAPVTPKAVAYGTVDPAEGRRHVGDTRILHGPRTDESIEGGERWVEIVRNGRVTDRARVPADGRAHDLHFEVNVDRSSWIALRQFPQLHTNPVNVLLNGRPIRASRASARWCAESVELLWRNQHHHIAESERPAARQAYDRALALYRQRAGEAAD